MPSHLVKVKSKLFIRSRRRIVRAIDGEYTSRARGRGFDFDDLRDYLPGDPVRDIDWKATARRGEPLVRRHLTTLQRSLIVIADTSATMNAVTPAAEPKAELAVHAAGILGYLAQRHGDRVGLVHGDAGGAHFRPAREGERHLDRLLGVVYDAIGSATAPADLAGLIEHALPRLRRDAIAIVVTDDADVDERLETAIRRLARAHDTLWVGIADANPAEVMATGAVADAVGRWGVPAYLARTASPRAGARATARRPSRLAAEYAAHAAQLQGRLTDLLDDAHVSRCRIESDDDALRELLTMLRRRPYAR